MSHLNSTRICGPRHSAQCTVVVACCSVSQCVTVRCSVLQCVAVCCSVLQCVAVCCSVLQCAAVRHTCIRHIFVHHNILHNMVLDVIDPRLRCKHLACRRQEGAQRRRVSLHETQEVLFGHTCPRYHEEAQEIAKYLACADLVVLCVCVCRREGAGGVVVCGGIVCVCVCVCVCARALRRGSTRDCRICLAFA